MDDGLATENQAQAATVGRRANLTSIGYKFWIVTVWVCHGVHALSEE